MSVAAMAAEVSVSDATTNNATIPTAPKAAPTVTVVAGGSQAARTVRVILTLVNATGESAAGVEGTYSVPASSVILVTSPGGRPSEPGAGNQYNVYATNGASLTETLQNTSPIAYGTNWQEPNSGFINGSSLPTKVNPYPALSANTNPLNTPPVTGAITVPQAPSGAITTNTGRSSTATQTYQGSISVNSKTQQGAAAMTSAPVYAGVPSGAPSWVNMIQSFNPFAGYGSAGTKFS